MQLSYLSSLVLLWKLCIGPRSCARRTTLSDALFEIRTKLKEKSGHSRRKVFGDDSRVISFFVCSVEMIFSRRALNVEDWAERVDVCRLFSHVFYLCFAAKMKKKLCKSNAFQRVQYV